METFEQMLQQTEKRFAQRESARTEARNKIKAGRLLEVDTPGRVSKRLERLKIDRETAEALFSGGISFAPIPPPGEPRPTDRTLLERILGTNDLIGINFLELGLRVSFSVGRVHIRSRTGSTVGYGTGFMVSPRLMMTNHHVLDNAETASFSQIEFNYQIGLDGKPSISVFAALSPCDFFLTDEQLDYTLVAVESQLPDGGEPKTFGWNRLLEEEGKIIKGECVNIIQHPNGEPKQLALRENQLEDVLDDWLHYRTDTAPGSSGSPVFNDQWELVALHHSGVPRRDAQGNILTRDGKIWDPSMGEHRIDWEANEGARISRIAKNIKAQSLSSEARRLRAEMFELNPFDQILSTSPVSRERGLQALTVFPVIRDDSGTSWTIPIEVTVRLGQPSPTSVIQVPGVKEVPVTKKPKPPPSLETDPEVQEALRELAAAKTRVYYDERGDTRAREKFYATIKKTLKAQSMYNQLSQLVRTTHKKQLKYQPIKNVYPWVDLHPDLMLHSIYSGKTFDPETFIKEDFQISYERARRLNERMAKESNLSADQVQEALDLLEAQLPYNCEHVVPQSWFGKLEPMRGDLHHLFACESGCNSFRGNQAYFDFPDFEEVTRNDCGKREENRFEPASGKGTVARATLYFLLRYPGKINKSGGELDIKRLPMLLNWHRRFPPDEYEKHRNMVIFAMQGNRNPLIDFPDWAGKTDFKLGFGE